MTAAAVKATFADWKLIKTRGVIQLVFEVPLHEADIAYQVVGGMPDAAAERWFAIARLKPESEVMPDTQHKSQPETPPASDSTTPARARKSWHEMTPAQQAGILCADHAFWAFLSINNYGPAWSEEDAANIVRRVCKVKTRSDIAYGEKANDYWMDLVSKYRTWQLAAKVVPA